MNLPDPFVGRAELLASLRQHLAAARDGRGRAVALVGPPGIGKTRTAEELLRAPGLRAARGRAPEGDGAPALWPWTQVVRALADGCDDALFARALDAAGPHLLELVPELRVRAPDRPRAPRLPSDSARFQRSAAVVAFVRAIARDAPVAALLDDVHWADVESVRLLAFAGRELRDAPALLLATCRAEEGRAALAELGRDAEPLALAGLTVAEVQRFLQEALGGDAGDDLAAAVHERTQGNPLFVRELARLMQLDGRWRRLGARALVELGVPAGIRHTLRSRLDRVSPTCRRVLADAAAIGDGFGLDVLSKLPSLMADLDPSAPALEIVEAIAEAEAAGLVRAVPGAARRWVFAHDLIRETLYDDLDGARQVALHQEIGEAIELIDVDTGDRLEELAHHFLLAAIDGDSGGKAVRYALAAARRADDRFAYDDEIRLLARALPALDLLAAPDAALRCELLLALGGAQTRAGDTDAARVTLGKAIDIARARRLAEPLARAALAWPLGTVGMFLSAGHFDPTLAELLREAVAALGDAPSALRALSLARLASAQADRDTPTAQAVAIARQLDDRRVLAEVLTQRHWALGGPEHTPARLALADEIVTLAEELHDPELQWRACTARIPDRLELGDRAGAERDGDRLARVSEQLNQPMYLWAGRLLRVLFAFLDGRFADAEQLAGAGLSIGQGAYPMDAMQAYSGQLAAIRREQGRLGELAPVLTGIATQFADVPVWRCSIAFALSQIGQLDDARRELARCMPAPDAGLDALPRDGFLMSALFFLAECCVAVDDRDRARAVYQALAPYADRHVVVVGALGFGSVARLLGALALVTGDLDAAVGHLEDAVEREERTRAVPWLAHALADLARAYRARGAAGDGARADRCAARAAALAAEHGMVALQQKLGSAAGDDEPAGECRFERAGEVWELAYEGESARIVDAKGLHYIAALLAAPGRELHVLELAGGAPQEHESEILDGRARDDYRRRAAELQAELDEAEQHADLGRVDKLRAELELLHDELRRAVGLGGRARKTAGNVERARKAVYNRIRSALDRVEREAPALARHLRGALRTGTFCVYDPERPVPWRM